MITINGRKILQDGVELHGRGYNYSNIPIGGTVWPNNEWTQFVYDVADLAEMGVNLVRFYYDPAYHPYYDAILNAFHGVGIKVVPFRYLTQGVDYSTTTGQINRNAMRDRVRGMVAALKYHPAIIGWGIGNETAHVLGPNTVTQVYEMINECIVAAKNIDSDRYYTHANAEIGNIINYGAAMPDIDVVGLNVYRGPSLTTLVSQIEANITKPVALWELGLTSYSSEATQAAGVVSLAQACEAAWPTISSYCFFQYHDILSKSGTPTMQDGTGEEHFGHTKVSAPGVLLPRDKKLAFTNLRNYFQSL